MLFVVPHMDPMSRKLLIYVSETRSPISSPGNSVTFHPHPHPSSTGFPIIAIIVMGMIITAFFLVCYYLFVIKYCLNWHRIDLLSRFSPSRRRHIDPLALYSPRIAQPRGLDEALIRLIPVIQYKSERNFSTECSVCLNEFIEEEKVRIIPTCSHVFHIDCIDVWLQNNVNCPVCRTSISVSKIDQILSVPQGGRQDREEDFVVIELDSDDGGGGDDDDRESPVMEKEVRRLKKVTSMGDESIENRAKDEEFTVKSIRRSVSMNSSGDRQFNFAGQDVLKEENGQVSSVEGSSSSSNGGGSNRVKRFFTFRHSKSRSISAVLPVYFD